MKKLKMILSFILILGLCTELFYSLKSEDSQAASKLGTPVIKLKDINDGTGIKVSISKTSNAEGYAIYVKKPSNKKFENVKTLKKNGKKKRSYKIQNLSDGEYEIKVKAYAKSGSKKVWGEYSSTQKISLKGKSTGVDNALLKYARQKYPKLAELAEQGLVGLTAEYRDVIKLGKWKLATDPFSRMGKTDIEWIVLKYSEDGKSALVISKYIVEMTAFDDNLEEATWENSGIRKWLNGDFYKGAFTKSERSLIKKVKLKNNPNSEYGTNGGKDTKDRIFLLSEEEYLEYFNLKTVDDASPNGRNVFIEGASEECWMRTPGKDNGCAMVSSEDGSIFENGWDIYMEMGVRPAFWIELTDEMIESNRLSVSDKYNGTESQLYVTFGSYYMEDSDGQSGKKKVPVEWEILDYDEKNGNVLLTSRFLIKKMQYDEAGKDTTWEGSLIRGWLNDNFYDVAFSETEKGLIKTTNVKNDGVNTKDKVFLLSSSDVWDYYYEESGIDSFYCGPCSFIDQVGYKWWLRDVEYGPRALIMSGDGEIDDVNGDVDKVYGVRPAINLFLDPSEAQKPIAPATPQATIKASKDSTGIEIEIEKTDDAEGYYIYLQKESDAAPVLYSTIEKDGSVKRSCYLKNITPGEYTVTIKAYRNEKGNIITGKPGKEVKLTLSGFDEVDYVKENYPELIKLAEQGIIGFDAKYGKDTIKLGRWKTDASQNKHYDVSSLTGTKEDIEWEVLEYSEDGKSALVISKYLIASGPYNSKDETVTWADCEVHEWLNGEFLTNVFTEDELKLIRTTTVKTNASEYDVDGGRDTEDKLFLLSIEEADKYYPKNEHGNRPGIEAIFPNGQIGDWYLRTPGQEPYDTSNWDSDDWEDFEIDEYAECYVAYVATYEWIDDEGKGVNREGGIRPAFWITLTPEIIESNNLDVNNSSKGKIEELYVTMGIFNGSGIEWKILDYDKTSGKALLVSRYVITEKEYDGTWKDVTWESCSLRNWLNDSFTNESLTDEEKAKILPTVIKSGKGGKIKTNDRIFILSLDEVDKYFPSNGVSDAAGRRCSNEHGSVKYWWLRSTGKASAYNSRISYLGSVGYNFGNSFTYGIRPALWLNLN